MLQAHPVYTTKTKDSIECYSPFLLHWNRSISISQDPPALSLLVAPMRCPCLRRFYLICPEILMLLMIWLWLSPNLL